MAPTRSDLPEAECASEVRRALAAARKRYVERHPRSLAAHRRATHHMPGGNTRSVLHVDPFPLFFERGDGATLTDVDGHLLDDLLGDYTSSLYGHSHPRILAALHDAARDGVGLGGNHRYEADLAALLVERFPAIDLVRFTPSGTEANLMALAAARVATGRDRVMVFSGAYHGGVLAFARPGRVNVPFDTVVGSYNDMDGTRSLIQRNGAELAAVIVEPMLQSGGCIPAMPGFLELLRSETEKVGALLIFDEVVTSRLHPRAVHGAMNLKPDLVTLGKYIGGGLPFGAFGGDASIMAFFDPRVPGFAPHAGTFNNNVLTMRVALAGLSAVYTPEAAAVLNARGEELRASLNALARDHQATLQFTGLGSIMGAHMTTRPIASPEDAAAGCPELRELLFFHLLEHNIYIAKRGMIALSLPTSDDQIVRLRAAVAGFLDRYRLLLTPANR